MTMTREEAAAHMERAVQAYQSRNYQQAADLFGELFVEPEAQAGAHEMHWNFALCQAHLGNFPLALEHVRASGYSETDFHDACQRDNIRDAQRDFGHAVELYQQQRWQEAADAFTELLLHPGYPAQDVATMHWNIAMCLAHLGDFQTALEHVRAGHHDEHQFREACHQQNLRDARHDFDHAVELSRQQRWQEAADAYTDLLLHPGFPAQDVATMHWNIAVAMAHLGRWDTAVEHVRAGHHDEAEFRRSCTESGLHPPEH